MASDPHDAPIALTPGEPAGIGPELVLMLAARGLCEPVVVLADPRLLEERAQRLGLDVAIETVTPPYRALPRGPGRLAVHPLALAALPAPGEADPSNARSLIAALDLAVAGCLDGRFAALVTGPVNKAVINDAGIAFTGHTEHLAAACGGADPVMLLVGGGLRVALATTHVPLAAVASAITQPHLERVIRVLHDALRRHFGCPRPAIVVLGLNPHAGEQGHLGAEEVRVIEPVIARLRGEGLELRGPIPADTAFLPERLQGADAVLAMYHDQGLPVLKYASFGRAVNVTLGLPLVRTSVDHGTAFDLAGRGVADPGSLEEALTCARRMIGSSR